MSCKRAPGGTPEARVVDERGFSRDVRIKRVAIVLGVKMVGHESRRTQSQSHQSTVGCLFA